MKIVLNKELVEKWNEKMGGQDRAAGLVKSVLQCSYSKADKIASGRYPSAPAPLERKALAKLMKAKESELFVAAPTATKDRAS